jgi:hypothetical protein
LIRAFEKVANAVILNSKNKKRNDDGAVFSPAKRLPVLTLYTKKPCPLCDEALERIAHLQDLYELEIVDITLPENKVWRMKYKYDIPVFHLDGEFLMKHRADPDLLVKRISEL